MILILSVLLILFSFGTVVILFGDSPTFRNTPIHRLRQYLMHHYKSIGVFLNRVDERWFHGFMYKSVGWIVPILYAVWIAYTIKIFFDRVYHLYPYPNSAFNRFYIPWTIFWLIASTILGVFSDPGEITSKNLAEANSFFINNQVIFFEDNTCRTCSMRSPHTDFIKPARSKHCNVCNRCVLLFDHHCIWLNNCIGYYNYRWFILFIIANLNFLVYATVLNYNIIHHAISSDDLKDWIFKKFGQFFMKSEANKISGTFFIICILFIIIASLFFAEHIRFLHLGITTNELGKWSDIQYLIRINTLYKLKNRVNNEIYVERILDYDKTSNSYKVMYISLKNDKVLANISIEDLIKTDDISELENIYDLGFWENVKFRLFPQKSRFL